MHSLYPFRTTQLDYLTLAALFFSFHCFARLAGLREKIISA